MKRDNIFWGAVLILFGVLFLLQNAGYIANVFALFWPLILILVGGWIVLGVFWKRCNGPAAIAGMLAGFVTCVFYMFGTEYFSEWWIHTFRPAEVATQMEPLLAAVQSARDAVVVPDVGPDLAVDEFELIELRDGRAVIAHLDEFLTQVEQAELGDWFRFEFGDPQPMEGEVQGQMALRYPVTCYLGGREFERTRLDVNLVGDHDSRPVEPVVVRRNPFAFVGAAALEVPMITPAHQLAEKLHAYVEQGMSRDEIVAARRAIDRNLAHVASRAGDAEVMLVAPNGRNAIVMGGAGDNVLLRLTKAPSADVEIAVLDSVGRERFDFFANDAYVQPPEHVPGLGDDAVRTGTIPGGFVYVVVGDRLETDIAAGQAVGCPTALVLSGVSTRAQAEVWEPAPTFILDDLSQLVK